MERVADKIESENSKMRERVWKEISLVGSEYATTVGESFPSYSSEAHQQAKTRFSEAVSNVSVSHDGAQSGKDFIDNTKKPTEDFLVAVIEPTSQAAIAIKQSSVSVSVGVTRAFCSGTTAVLGVHDSPRVYAHELGHVLENTIPDLRSAAVAFQRQRCDPADERKMADVFPSRGYAETETSNKDNFDKAASAVYGAGEYSESVAHYTGKVYRDTPDSEPHATEIISTGMQMLYDNPAKFAKADPEYFDFMVGVVSGHVSHANWNMPRDGDGDGVVNEEEKNKNKAKK